MPPRAADVSMTTGGPESASVHYHYDIHGLLSLDISGTNTMLSQALDKTFSPFRTESESADFKLQLGPFPSSDWEPSGSTVGDRMLYDPSIKQTTVFGSALGIKLKKEDVLYVIRGEPRVGTGPVTVSVPDNSLRVGRLRQAAVESLDLEGRRALLALAGDSIFRAEDVEQDAEGLLQTVLEPFLYYRLPNKGSTLVHGAALSADESGVLILGLASVGKTSLALQLVKKGYVYYGDDLPMVRKDGELLANPKPIKLRSQHIDLFPELADTIARGMNGKERFLLAREVRNHKPKFMKRLPRRSLGDIFEGAKIGSQVKLKTIVFLKRVAGKEFTVGELDREELVRLVAADLFFQFPCAPWRRTMYYFCPSVALGNDFMAEEDEHHGKIIEILKGAFSSAKIVMLNAPMEFRSSDLESQVLKAIS